ncbi:ATPase synthesis protein 25, mitochondrial [Aspergillus navahoensis]
MNTTLLRAPRRFQHATSVLTSTNSSIARHAFLTYGRVRALTSTSHLSTENHPSLSSSTSNATPVEGNDTPKTQRAPEPSQHIPWYLREESSVPAVPEVASREKLPELPENPPKILPELLEYIFKDLGLDELKLIDLRPLETPSALGANVIMIIGTARSVKHLNVSADRLCRWLRSEHKLSPYADGLLGRNELKIKLRRKNRRARIASRTGAMFDDKDDGITTGWICVNAGVVEKHPVPERVEGDFEGFGPLVGGTRVVVQVFTAEKRTEMDLETLWEGRLARAQREREKHADVAKDDAPEEVRYPNSISPSPSDYKSPNVLRSWIDPPHEQRRQFHNRIQQPFTHPWHNAAFMQRFMLQTRAFTGHATRGSELSSQTAMLLQYITTLPAKQMMSALGDKLDGENSTDFLRLFNHSLSGASLNIVALARLELLCLAHSRGHTGISRKTVHHTFMGCCISASRIPDRLIPTVVDILLTPRRGDDPEGEEWFTDADKEIALSVLDQLVLRGYDFMNLQFLTRLYYLSSLPPGPPGEEESDDGLTQAERGAHVVRMIETLDIPFDAIHARTLMVYLFRNGDYDAFMKWWRTLPLKNSPRTREDYEMLFRLHAESGDARLARECISTWVPMMSREDPPVWLEGELVPHIRDCLLLADERTPARAAEGTQSLFAKLWRACERELNKANEK